MTYLPPQRHLFDIPENVAYFNCAYMSPLLMQARDALIAGAAIKCRPWERKPEDFFTEAESFRKLSAKLFGGDADSYAITPSASYGCSTIALILEERFGSGDEILLLDETFPSNYLPWARLAETTGATIKTAPTPDDHNWTQSVLDRLGPKTRLVALPYCHWTNGAALDLETIADATRSIGAYLVLELTQSVGAAPLDVDRIKPDFVVAAGYKWMMTPYGFGLFYAAPQWHDARPLEETWLSRQDAQNFEGLANYAEAYQPGARRFEMGEKSIPTILPGALVAMRQLDEWGIQNISNTLGALNDKLAASFVELGLNPIAKQFRAPHIIGVAADKGLPDDLLQRLSGQNVYIGRRGRSLRIAPHLHITDNDVDRLLETLKAVLN